MATIQPMQEQQHLMQDQLSQLEATITLVGESAQVAMPQVATNHHVNQSEWREWPLVDCDDFMNT